MSQHASRSRLHIHASERFAFRPAKLTDPAASSELPDRGKNTRFAAYMTAVRASAKAGTLGVPLRPDPGRPDHTPTQKVSDASLFLSTQIRFGVALAVLSCVVIAGSGGDEKGRVRILTPWTDDWLTALRAYEPREPLVVAAIRRWEDAFLALIADLGPISHACPSRLSLALFVWALDERGVDLDDVTAVNAWLTDDGIAEICAQVGVSEKLTSRPTLRDHHTARIGYERRIDGCTKRPNFDYPIVRQLGWFTPAETWTFLSDCDDQRSAYLIDRCRKILTLGFGAGLTAAEISRLGEQHIYESAGAVWIDVVDGDKPRRVPVDADFADLLRPLQNYPASDYLLGEESLATVNGSLVHASWSIKRPGFRAMNLTWLRNRVMAGADLSATFAASQYKTLKVWSRCLDDIGLVTTPQWMSVSRPHPDSAAPR